MNREKFIQLAQKEKNQAMLNALGVTEKRTQPVQPASPSPKKESRLHQLEELTRYVNPKAPHASKDSGPFFRTALDTATLETFSPAYNMSHAIFRKLGGDERPLPTIYDEQAARSQRQQKNFSKKYPKEELLAYGLGSLAPTGAFLSATKAIKALGAAAKAGKALPSSSRAVAMLKNVAKSGALGAGAGTYSAIMEQLKMPSNEREFSTAFTYGPLGGALAGASLGAVAHGLGAAVKKINKKMIGRKARSTLEINPDVVRDGEELFPASEDEEENAIKEFLFSFMDNVDDVRKFLKRAEAEPNRPLAALDPHLMDMVHALYNNTTLDGRHALEDTLHANNRRLTAKIKNTLRFPHEGTITQSELLEKWLQKTRDELRHKYKKNLFDNVSYVSDHLSAAVPHTKNVEELLEAMPEERRKQAKETLEALKPYYEKVESGHRKFQFRDPSLPDLGNVGIMHGARALIRHDIGVYDRGAQHVPLDKTNIIPLEDILTEMLSSHKGIAKVDSEYRAMKEAEDIIKNPKFKIFGNEISRKIDDPRPQIREAVVDRALLDLTDALSKKEGGIDDGENYVALLEKKGTLNNLSRIFGNDLPHILGELADVKHLRQSVHGGSQTATRLAAANFNRVSHRLQEGVYNPVGGFINVAGDILEKKLNKKRMKKNAILLKLSSSPSSKSIPYIKNILDTLEQENK